MQVCAQAPKSNHVLVCFFPFVSAYICNNDKKKNNQKQTQNKQKVHPDI